ncbi:MAG: DUF362 domain-containing protein [Desulfovibrio sp.]|jgi:uncharacterized protein (DUF362 family)|nr:DUF362 domain-containing protein [Desulfovibrio sp.]
MLRRDFLKLNAIGILGCGLSFPFAGDAFAADPYLVVAKGEPGPATRAAVQGLGGMARFVQPGQKVVIKPNMSFDQGPAAAVNTHPDVVRELVVMCKEAGAGKIRVLDHSLHNPRQSLERSGILAACDSVETGICHHLMSGSQYAEATIPDGKEMRKNAFMKDVLEADVIIAAPVAKSHSSAGVSLCLKGQMGLIQDRHVMHSRYDLDVSIVDLATRVKPALSVVDATRVLTSGGPGGPGRIITPGEVIASADPVAADAMAVSSYEWYGRKQKPRQVAHIRLAHERGLGRMDIDALNVARIAV